MSEGRLIALCLHRLMMLCWELPPRGSSVTDCNCINAHVHYLSFCIVCEKPNVVLIVNIFRLQSIDFIQPCLIMYQSPEFEGQTITTKTLSLFLKFRKVLIVPWMVIILFLKYVALFALVYK